MAHGILNWAQRLFEVELQLAGHFLGNISAGASKLCAVALLGGCPQHIAIQVTQSHSGIRFMFAFLDVVRLVLSNGNAAIPAGATARDEELPPNWPAFAWALIPSCESNWSVYSLSLAAPRTRASARSGLSVSVNRRDCWRL